jgi:hypothetical protein
VFPPSVWPHSLSRIAATVSYSGSSSALQRMSLPGVVIEVFSASRERPVHARIRTNVHVSNDCAGGQWETCGQREERAEGKLTHDISHALEPLDL